MTPIPLVPVRAPRRQRGVAILLAFSAISLAAIAWLASTVEALDTEVARQRRTNDALAQAKQALIAFAVGQNGGNDRPGLLPCPDTHTVGPNEGTEDDTCAAGSLGRLPWKKLGLPDLRDGSGERLWYAVTRLYAMDTPDYTNPANRLNSNSTGKITVRKANMQIINDGRSTNAAATTAAIAVIIAPGRAFTPVAGVAQSRGTADYLTVTNYLENTTTDGNTFFVENSTNGFVDGPVYDYTGKLVLNDRLAVISWSDLMPKVEQRVLRQIRDELRSKFNGIFPWAAPFSNPATRDSHAMFSVNNTTEGLVPVSGYYWRIDPVGNASYTRTGTVTNAHLEQGWLEPGYCSGFSDTPPFAFSCTALRRDQANNTEREIQINATSGTLSADNGLTPTPRAKVIGTSPAPTPGPVVVTITDRCYAVDMTNCPSIGFVRGSGTAALFLGSLFIGTYAKVDAVYPANVAGGRLFEPPLWFFQNDWHRLIYYGVSAAEARPNAAIAPCGGAAPACISLVERGTTRAAKSVLVAASRPVSGQDRALGTLDQYFEGANQNTADTLRFEATNTTLPFNDRAVAVRLVTETFP